MSERAITHRRWSIDDVKHFVRPVYFGFTSSQVLMGVAAVTAMPDLNKLIAILAVAAAYHVFTYVQNDVMDLPIDRTQPLRAEDPLVSGLISPGTAMTIALVQIPIAFMITWWIGGNIWAYVTLVVGFVFMTLYNLYGKRCSVPMITDAVQGISWGTLAVYGSLIAAGQVNYLTFIAAGFGFGFLFLINGIHGGLRDLCNDLEIGCKTTAIFFGAKPDAEFGVRSTTAVRAYAFFALTVYLGPATVALFSGQFGYTGTGKLVAYGAWITLGMVSVWALWLMTATVIRNRNSIIRHQTLPLLLAPIMLFLPRMDPALIAVALICFFLPFPIFDIPTKNWFKSVLRRR